MAWFFAAFVVPSMVLAVLALRSYHLAMPGGREREVRRAARYQLAAGALPFAMVLLTALATGGAPFVSPGGWGFLGYGVAALALGLAGFKMFPRAAADPRRKTRKAAETTATVLLMVDLVFLVNAMTAFPA